MATVTLKDGRKFQVDDSFKKLSPDQQRGIVDEWKRKNPPPEAMGTGEDVVRSGARGLAEGTIGLGGALGDVKSMGTGAANWVRGKFGLEPATEYRLPGDTFEPPTSAELTEKAKQNIPGARGVLEHEPQTRAGRLARTAGEFAPGAVAGPGRMGVKLAQAGASALGAEAAGQTAERFAPGLEPYARIAGSIAGGGLPTKRLNRQAVEELIPSTDQYRRAKSAAYAHASMSGNQLHPQDFSFVVDDLTRMAERRGGGILNKTMTPGINQALNIMADRAATGMPLSVDDIDTMRQVLKNRINVMQPGERDLLRQMVDRYDQLVDRAVPAELKEARRLNVRYKRSELMDELGGIVERQGKRFSQSGSENAIRERARNLANAEARKRMAGRRSQFNQRELDRINQVAVGGPVRNAARWVGKLAPTSILPFSGSLGGSALGYMLSGSPEMAMLIGGGMAGLGGIGRGIATGLARQDMRRAEELIRAGPQVAGRAEALRQKLRREALARALITAHQAGR